jgi:hypothetical protein
MNTVERKAQILVATSGFCLGFFQLVSYDIWWHLAGAEWLIDNLSFPYTDPFSFTTLGRRWVYHNWLFDLPLLGVYKTAGVGGLVFFRCVLVSIFGIAVYSLLRLKLSPAQAAALTIVILAGLRIRFLLRPLFASFILFTLLLHLLVRLYEKNMEKVSMREMLPAVSILFFWANLHAGAVFGLILIGTFFVSAVIAGRTVVRNARPFAMLLLMSFVAGLINPNGLETFLYAFRYLGFKGSVASLNEEHAPPPLPWEDGSLSIYWVTVAVSSLLYLYRMRRGPPYLFILLAGFAYLGVTSLRGMAFFSIVAVFCAAYVWEERLKQIRVTMVSGTLAAVAVVLAAAALQPLKVGAGIDMKRIPVSAASFADESGFKGNLFNSHPYGGYLIHRLYPKHKVFIDGRDLLHSATIKQIEKFGYARLLKTYGVEWVVVGYRDGVLGNLSPESWAVVFFDDISVLLARRGGPNSELIEKYAYRAVTPFNIEKRLTTASELEKAEIKTELERAVKSSSQTTLIAGYLDRL